MNKTEEALEKHRQWRGKLEIKSRVPLATKEDLAVAYTPGVAEPCLAIEADKALVYDFTRKWNTVAVITDGTAVLGLGDIGPEAALPVMEGKCVLFKEFADIDAIPLCLDTKNADELVNTIRILSPAFGGINLEDISAPRCFEVEARLKELLPIPVFHDDQHGTAIVALAALINALRLSGKKKESAKVVISGAGSAGTAIAKLLLRYGFVHIIMCDKEGILNREQKYSNGNHNYMAEVTNPECIAGGLSEAMAGADVFIGVSAPGIVNGEMVSSMAEGAVVFAMANPVPEIMPDDAKKAGARIVATGRSDFPNQINNVLVFPGIFRGALDARAAAITEEMKLAAAEALSELITDEELTEDYIIPSPFDKRVCERVAAAVHLTSQL